MEKFNKFSKNKYSKLLLFVILDVLILIFTSIFSLYIRFDFGLVPLTYYNNILNYLWLDTLILLFVFFFFKLYTSVWTYASVFEIINTINACLLFEIICFLYKLGFDIKLPNSYYFIQAMLLIITVGGIRFSYRVVRTIIQKLENRKRSINTMIVGAGQAGRLLINEIENNKNGFNNRIICLIDDSREKIGSYINGKLIVGNSKSIEKNSHKYNIDEIIIAMPSASKDTIASIVEECQKTKCNIRILPMLNELLDGGNFNAKDIAKKVRPLSYEDFLGRSQIVVDSLEIKESITNKTIMVTGGGGSIGSELCRQIAKCNPKKLVIFDIYENNAYDIEQELIRNYPELNLETIIGSVRDYDRLEKVFKDNKFDMIFHAAAHKHVPLMEVSPNEAIKNNCLGTLNVARLAGIYKVSKFVLISTDKAVRPTNIMGASKRICEMIIQSLDKEYDNTDYVAVRFGNVLGSNGSVIPLFLKQIENGGPVTVTHKDITRYFMTIPEAVSLVLQASVYALGGEIFVLDMGEPVKIYELAKKIIRYKGLEPDKDIEIKITGLRPGEKLYEEMLMEEEGLKETPNKLIHIGKPIEISKSFLKDLDKLITSAYKNNDDIKNKVAKIVDTYKVDKRGKK